MSDQPPALPARFQPIPTGVSVIGVQHSGRPMVVLLVEHAAGTNTYGWDPDNSEQIGNMLIEAAKSARTNLTVPRSGLIVPGTGR